MAEITTSVEKDPYMQAYITARMKNQVEEMKLQKILSSMEVSQRIRKIMINLELYEDRRIAHKLQREVMNIASRQRKAMTQFLRQRSCHQHQGASCNSPLCTCHTDPALHSNTLFGDLALPLPHPPDHPGPGQHRSKRGVYPVTKGKEHGLPGRDAEGEASHASCARERALTGRGPTGAATVETGAIPAIHITDTSVAQSEVAWEGSWDRTGSVKEAPPRTPGTVKVTTSAKKVNSPLKVTLIESPRQADSGVGVAHPAKTATIVTPPPDTPVPRVPQLSGSRPVTDPLVLPTLHTSPDSVQFPPVTRSPRRTQYTARPMDRKRADSACSSVWPGDPRAIRSVRRQRRDIEQMMASLKAGEETRRLIREAQTTCSRNCAQPDIMALLGRAYVNLPDLLPEIEKARKRMAEDETAAMEPPLDESMSSEKRKSMGRFDLEDDATAPGSKNLPIYHINYASLREIGGTRRNSVLV